MSAPNVSKTKKIAQEAKSNSPAPEGDFDFFRTLVPRLDANSRVPLYKQISGMLEQSIEAGLLDLGTRLPSERQLTTILGVSRCTLRGALTELIERKYLATAKGMGNFVLPPPKRRKLYFISVERYSVEYWPLSPLHYKWLETGGGANDADVLYRYVESTEELHAILENPPEVCNGIILFRPNSEWTEYLSKMDESLFENSSVPIILIGRSIRKKGLNVVSLDYVEAARLGTRQLIEQGHQKIGFIGWSSQNGFCHLPYFEGYQAAMMEAGLPIVEEHCCLFSVQEMKSGSPSEGTAQRLKDFLRNRRFTGLVVSIINPYVERLLQQLGIVVPDDLSAVSLMEQHLVDTFTMRWSGFQMASNDLASRGLTVLSDICRGIRKNGHFEEIPVLPVPGATSRELRRPEIDVV